MFSTKRESDDGQRLGSSDWLAAQSSSRWLWFHQHRQGTLAWHKSAFAQWELNSPQDFTWNYIPITYNRGHIFSTFFSGFLLKFPLWSLLPSGNVLRRERQPGCEWLGLIIQSVCTKKKKDKKAAQHLQKVFNPLGIVEVVVWLITDRNTAHLFWWNDKQTTDDREKLPRGGRVNTSYRHSQLLLFALRMTNM